jgi:hypothetical protein
MKPKRLPHLFALASALFITPVNAQASAVLFTAASRKIQAMKSALLTVWAVVILCSGTGIAGAATASGTYLDAMTTHALGSDTSLSDPDWSRGIITDGTLYVAFKAQQSDVRIVANQTTNDVGFGLDDFVGVGIDTSGAQAADPHELLENRKTEGKLLLLVSDAQHAQWSRSGDS